MSLDELLSAGLSMAQALQGLAIALASLALGWYLVLNAGYRIAKWSDHRRQYGWPSIFMRASVGAVFISAQWTLSAAAETFTGQGMDENSAMSVFQSGGSPVQRIVGVVLAWVAFLGVVAVLRGFMLWVKAADNGGGGSVERDPMWAGSIFIIAGAVGINMWRFIGPLL